jgi:protease II
MAVPAPPGTSPSTVSPPVPERRPVRLEAHGDVRLDDWYWLRDKDDPVVIEHLQAENAYTEWADRRSTTRSWAESRRRT